MLTLNKVSNSNLYSSLIQAKTPEFLRVKWLIFLIGPLDLIVMWFSEDQRPNIIKTRVYNRSDYIFSFNNYSTLNGIHNLEDLCIQLKNPRTCTYNSPVLSMIIVDVSMSSIV